RSTRYVSPYPVCNGAIRLTNNHATERKLPEVLAMKITLEIPDESVDALKRTLSDARLNRPNETLAELLRYELGRVFRHRRLRCFSYDGSDTWSESSCRSWRRAFGESSSK